MNHFKTVVKNIKWTKYSLYLMIRNEEKCVFRPHTLLVSTVSLNHLRLDCIICSALLLLNICFIYKVTYIYICNLAKYERLGVQYNWDSYLSVDDFLVHSCESFVVQNLSCAERVWAKHMFVFRSNRHGMIEELSPTSAN